MRPEQFSPLQVKYALPPFEEMDRHYDLAGIDDESTRFLRDVAHKMSDRFDAVLKILEDILQPESNVATLHESAAFSDAERQEIFHIYQLLMAVFREGQAFEIEADQEKIGHFLTRAHKEYLAMLPHVVGLLRRLQATWGIATLTRSELGYFG